MQAEREVASTTGPLRKLLDVVADRFRLQGIEKARAIEAIETALRRGGGRVNVYAAGDESAEPQLWRYSTGLHCPRATCATPIRSRAVLVQLCCRRLRHLPRLRPRDRRRLGPRDPDGRRRCATARSRRSRRRRDPGRPDYAGEAGIPRTAWYQLGAGAPRLGDRRRPGLEGPLEQTVVRHPALLRLPRSKAYKMHIRVLCPSTAATPCPACGGRAARTEALLWRMG